MHARGLTCHGLTCHFAPPERGWLRVRTEGPSTVVAFLASHTPLDSVSELAGVLLRILRFGAAGEVAWREEPERTLTAFDPRGDRVRLRVETVSGGRRVTLLEHDDNVRSVVQAFVSALKRLDADSAAAQYEAGWGHPFPHDAVAQLNRLLGGPPT